MRPSPPAGRVAAHRSGHQGGPWALVRSDGPDLKVAECWLRACRFVVHLPEKRAGEAGAYATTHAWVEGELVGEGPPPSDFTDAEVAGVAGSHLRVLYRPADADEFRAGGGAVLGAALVHLCPDGSVLAYGPDFGA